MDLATRYLGLQLRNPLIAAASPLSNTIAGVRQLADAGVGAIVLYSLFEEQVRQEAAQNADWAEAGTESFAESLSYFPAAAGADPGPRRYLSLIERAVAAVDIPVIASLNAVTAGGWTRYAAALEQAGATAIELNIYHPLGDPTLSGREVEQRHLDIVMSVKAAVSVPVAVKLHPYFSSIAEMAERLDSVGADGLVLFNRFLQPDIDHETLTVSAGFGLSHPAEGRLPRAWIALLAGRTRASLAATTGVYDARRRRPVSARRGRRGDDGIGAPAARPDVRGRIARRACQLDVAHGIRRAARDARAPVGAGRRRRIGQSARRLRHSLADSQYW